MAAATGGRPMGTISVYLENGFEQDFVIVSAGGPPSELTGVTTRHQVGLAAVVEPAIPDTGLVTVRVEVPRRGLVAERAVDPRATPYVRVDVDGGVLALRAETSPPRFA
jgi:hypothetical protein